MICSKCGKELRDSAKFCTACGAKVENVVPVPIEEPKFVEEPKPAEEPVSKWFTPGGNL